MPGQSHRAAGGKGLFCFFNGNPCPVPASTGCLPLQISVAVLGGSLGLAGVCWGECVWVFSLGQARIWAVMFGNFGINVSAVVPLKGQGAAEQIQTVLLGLFPFEVPERQKYSAVRECCTGFVNCV